MMRNDVVGRMEEDAENALIKHVRIPLLSFDLSFTSLLVLLSFVLRSILTIEVHTGLLVLTSVVVCSR